MEQYNQQICNCSFYDRSAHLDESYQHISYILTGSCKLEVDKYACIAWGLHFAEAPVVRFSIGITACYHIEDLIAPANCELTWYNTFIQASNPHHYIFNTSLLKITDGISFEYSIDLFEDDNNVYEYIPTYIYRKQNEPTVEVDDSPITEPKPETIQPTQLVTVVQPSSRILPDDFNWKTYLEINTDVARIFQTKDGAINHYLYYGIQEMRIYKFTHIPPDFDWEVYLELNPDIKAVIRDRINALHHYNRHGYTEKRTYKFSNIPDDFDWEFYLALNPDVRQAYPERVGALYHYHKYGYKEDRRYNLIHLPADFDCDTYVALNQDIPYRFLHAENSIKMHYEMYGRIAGRKYKISRTNVPDNFNWKIYMELNPTITLNTELDAIIHYNSIGFYKQLPYQFDSCIINGSTNRIDADFIKYPFLFHKYLLNITHKDAPITYSIEQTTSILTRNSFATHLHCYDIDKFDMFYAYCIENLIECSDVIVTYSVGTKLPNDTRVTVLKIENKGMDIGAKYVVVRYLKDNNHPYTHILFLHSKTDEHTRKLYWTPLLANLQFIRESALTHPEIGIYVPPLIYIGDYNHCLYTHHLAELHKIYPQWNPGNVWYMDDIDNYMGFNQHNKFFPEGNCFFANKHVAESLYSDVILYNILNTVDTFDAVWIKVWYGDIQNRRVGTNIYEIYDFYMTNRDIMNLHPNNIKMGHLGYRDNMIEHCYERTIFKMIETLGYDAYILPPIGTKTPSDAHTKFNVLLNRYFKTKQLE